MEIQRGDQLFNGINNPLPKQAELYDQALIQDRSFTAPTSLFYDPCKNPFSRWFLIHCYLQGPLPDNNEIPLQKIKRQFDGRNNNKKNPQWGAANTALARASGTSYKDGVSEPIDTLPNPRVISNTLGSLNSDFQESVDKVTMAFTIWGQFLDHDLDLTQGGQEQLFPINIPPNDPFYKQVKQIPFTRAKFIKDAESKIRQHPNEITTWIDGSQIYGSNEIAAKELRTLKNGKLKVSGNNLLPRQKGFFIAGDIRVNENIILTSFHTIFVREHNRLCEQLNSAHPEYSDQQIYQITRNYVIGLLQKITYQDFLPILLGKKGYRQSIGPYQRYDSRLDPSIFIEFSTAAFRVGHPLLVSEYPILNKKGKQIEKLKLKDMFFNPEALNPTRMAGIFRGISQTLAKQRSEKLIDDVRNFLVLGRKDNVFLDLYSLNIQRGRDIGLSLYNKVRKSFGLSSIPNFQTFTLYQNLKLAKKLQQLYKTPDNMDLWVGIISQPKVKGAILGQLGIRIVGETFRKIRDADRYWYENIYPDNIVRQIKDTSLSDIIKRNVPNTDIIQDDVFHFYGSSKDSDSQKRYRSISNLIEVARND